MSKAKLSTERIERALRDAGGFYAHAAKALEIDRTTLYRRIKRNSHLQQVVEEILEETTDLAESKLVNAIKKGQPWAIQFYLKCKGKKRGYVERQEVTGAEGEPVRLFLTPVKGLDTK